MPKKKRKTKARVRRAKPSRKPRRGRTKKGSSRRKALRKTRRSRPARRKKARKLKRSPKRVKPRRKKAKTRKKPRKVIDPRVAQAMKTYAEGMRYFNKQSFRRARSLFEKVAGGFSRALAERARVHIAICDRQLRRPPPVRLRGADDHYHYAVAKINTGEYEEARMHLQKALKRAPKADYVHYALATVAALTGEAEEALERLERAIKLRSENRYQARNDADFKLLEDDVRFQELVYPDQLPGANLDPLRI